MTVTPKAAQDAVDLHHAQQALLAKQAEDQVAAVWPLLDVADLDATFPALAEPVATIVATGNKASAGATSQFLTQHRAAWGVGDIPDLVVAGAPPGEQVLASLHATSVAAAKTAIGNGVAPEVAMQTALGTAQGAMSRLVLNGGRDTMHATGAKDPHVIRYARVLGGSRSGPCPFCSMLASRGAVYKNEAKFHTHDHCRCTNVPEYDLAADYVPPDWMLNPLNPNQDKAKLAQIQADAKLQAEITAKLEQHKAIVAAKKADDLRVAALKLKAEAEAHAIAAEMKAAEEAAYKAHVAELLKAAEEMKAKLAATKAAKAAAAKAEQDAALAAAKKAAATKKAAAKKAAAKKADPLPPAKQVNVDHLLNQLNSGVTTVEKMKAYLANPAVSAANRADGEATLAAFAKQKAAKKAASVPKKPDPVVVDKMVGNLKSGVYSTKDLQDIVDEFSGPSGPTATQVNAKAALAKHKAEQAAAKKLLPKAEQQFVDAIYDDLKAGKYTTDQVLSKAAGLDPLSQSNALAGVHKYELNQKAIATARAKRAAKSGKPAPVADLAAAQARFRNSKTFTSEDAARRYAEGHWPGGGKYASAQLQAMRSYTSSGYGRINTALREQRGAPTSHATVKALDSMMEHAPRVAEDVIITRNGGYKILGLGPETHVTSMVGQTFTEWAFMSTTVNPAGVFGGALKLKLRVPAGTRATYVSHRSYDTISAVGQGEAELVLARGTEIRILSVTKNPGGGYGSGEWTIEAEVVAQHVSAKRIVL